MLTQQASDYRRYNRSGQGQSNRDLSTARLSPSSTPNSVTGHTNETVRASGPSRRLKQDELGDLGQDESDEHEIDAGQAKHQRAKRQGKQPRDRETEDAEQKTSVTP